MTTTTPLAGELAAVRNELNRVDAKCGTLTGLTGAGLTFLATQVGHGPTPVRALLGVAGVLLAVATGTLLTVLRPRLGATGFRRYAVMDVAQIERLLTNLGPEVIEAEDLAALSRITNRKYIALRRAADLTVAAVAVIGLALLIGVAT